MSRFALPHQFVGLLVIQPHVARWPRLVASDDKSALLSVIYTPRYVTTLFLSQFLKSEQLEFFSLPLQMGPKSFNVKEQKP